jgi:purine-binding chemotaxis protein CheW
MTPDRDAPDRDVPDHDAPERIVAEGILAERARRLARRADPVAVDVGAGRARHVDFALARERWLLDARHVLAAFRLATLTPLPGAVAPVVGLTAWRGLVLTLVDLRRTVGAQATGLDDLATVLVVGEGERAVAGILADVVHGVATLDPARPLRPPPPARSALPGVITGVTDDARLVLDGTRLLALLEEPRALPAARDDARPPAALPIAPRPQ